MTSKNSFKRSHSFGNTEKIYLSWEGYGEYINDLCTLIKNRDAVYSYVYGIPRGGLIPAVTISNQLGIELLTFLKVTKEFKNYSILLVDDIIDTGKVLNLYTNEILKGCKLLHTATIFKHSKSQHNPTFYVKETDKWIIFPYEKEPK